MKKVLFGYSISEVDTRMAALQYQLEQANNDLKKAYATCDARNDRVNELEEALRVETEKAASNKIVESNNECENLKEIEIEKLKDAVLKLNSENERLKLECSEAADAKTKVEEEAERMSKQVESMQREMEQLENKIKYVGEIYLGAYRQADEMRANASAQVNKYVSHMSDSVSAAQIRMQHVLENIRMDREKINHTLFDMTASIAKELDEITESEKRVSDSIDELNIIRSDILEKAQNYGKEFGYKLENTENVSEIPELALDDISEYGIETSKQWKEIEAILNEKSESVSTSKEEAHTPEQTKSVDVEEKNKSKVQFEELVDLVVPSISGVEEDEDEGEFPDANAKSLRDRLTSELLSGK